MKRTVLLCSIAFAGACGPSVDLTKGLHLEAVSTGWLDAGVVDGKNKVVPAVSFKLKNVSDQPLKTLQWLRKARAELFDTNLLPPFEELQDLCQRQPNRYHSVVRNALENSPEFLQMEFQHQSYKSRFHAARKDASSKGRFSARANRKIARTRSLMLVFIGIPPLLLES